MAAHFTPIVVQQGSQAAFMSHLATLPQWLPGRVICTHLGTSLVAPVPLPAGRCHRPLQRRKWRFPGTGPGWATYPLSCGNLPVHYSNAAMRHLPDRSVRHTCRKPWEPTRLTRDQVQCTSWDCNLPHSHRFRLGLYLDTGTDARLLERNGRRTGRIRRGGSPCGNHPISHGGRT